MRVYICGSHRFLGRMETLERKLRKEGVEVLISKKIDDPSIIGCLDKIDEADIVYVVDPNGYVGKSVSVDIGYAYARKKSIYVMTQIDDPPVMKLVKGALSFQEVLTLLKGRD